MSKKTKKAMSMLLVVTLIAVIAIGGMLAYLTDRDSEANVFTVGDVSIKLNEVFDEKNAELIPGVDIKKEATITNTGDNDAWVWLTVLLPEEMGPYTAPDNMSASNNVVHWNYPKESAANITVDFNSTTVDVDTDGDGVTESYYQTNMLWNNVLEAGETTGAMLSKVYMDTHVDIDPDGNMYWVVDGVTTDLNWNVNEKGNPVIHVSAYAIQEEGFETVEEAYAAYQTQWGANGAEYTTVVTNEADLKAALAAGGRIRVGNDIETAGTASLEVAADESVILDLDGYTITNGVPGAPALVNYGSLTIEGDGAIVNGVSDTAKSHTIRNYGDLTINGGNIGTSNTAGAAVVNDGTATINGGTFASRQESSKGAGFAAYIFLNNASDAVLTINDATVTEPTHGLFGSYYGEIIINGGDFTLTGDLACYITYTSEGKVTINDGVINQEIGRNGHSFYGKAGYDQKVIDNHEVIINGGEITTVATVTW